MSDGGTGSRDRNRGRTGPAAIRVSDALNDCAKFWSELEMAGRVLEFEGLRRGWASTRDKKLPVPRWLLDEPAVWAGVPLLHHQRLVGLVVLAAPDYRRQLDWEDFDLLRSAGTRPRARLPKP